MIWLEDEALEPDDRAASVITRVSMRSPCCSRPRNVPNGYSYLDDTQPERIESDKLLQESTVELRALPVESGVADKVELARRPYKSPEDELMLSQQPTSQGTHILRLEISPRKGAPGREDHHNWMHRLLGLKGLPKRLSPQELDLTVKAIYQVGVLVF